MRIALAQRLLGAARLGHVARDVDKADQLALGVAQGRLGVLQHDLARGRAHGFLEQDGLQRAQHLLVVLREAGRLLGADEVGHGAAQHLLGGLAEHVRAGAVVEQEAALQVLGEDEVGAARGDGLQQAQRLQPPAVRREFAPLLRRVHAQRPPAHGQHHAGQAQDQADEHPQRVLPVDVVDLGQVDLGHQPPVGARHRVHGGHELGTAVVRADEQRLLRRAVRGPVLASGPLAGRGRDSVPGGVGVSARIAERDELPAVLMPQHGLAGARGRRPAR